MSVKIICSLYTVIFLNTVSGTFLFFEIDGWGPARPAFDPEIYENALDPEICSDQLAFIRNNTGLRLLFLGAGMRFPRGLTQFNTLDLGNYDQCLDINQDIGTSVIEGKYCMIEGPLDENFMDIAEAMNWDDFDNSMLSENNLNKFRQIDDMQSSINAIIGINNSSRTIIGDLWNVVPTVRMALCVPKTCTTQEGMRGLLFNLTRLGFRYRDQFCRFKDDKPWVPGDYVAISIFVLIGLLAIVSTTYDVCHTLILKKDPKTANTLYRSFSVYTNGKRLTTFTHNPNNLNCMDGIRAISMFWIVAGHAYLLNPTPQNALYVYFEWLLSLGSTWLTAAQFTVDTFLLLAGILLVYTTVGKLSGKTLLKRLHLFYLNRILRLFPLLATVVLLTATLLHKISDGPQWQTMETNTNNCRANWWLTLLYVQNFINYRSQCVSHSWYLAIDIQCYIVAPIVLYWVLKNNKKEAWIALVAGCLATHVVCTTYSFIYQFQGWSFAPVRPGGNRDYQFYYYFNTLTRAPPFFIGMIFGYILYDLKGKKLNIPYYVNGILWIVSGGTLITLMYVTYLMKKDVFNPENSWDYWIVDDLFNSFARSIWAVCVGWIIIACQHGYGGPVNWFLCLDIWKLPSRISYALYLFHYPIQFVIQGTAKSLIIFSDLNALYNFLAQALISYGVAFAMTLLIDLPFSVLIKLVFGDGPKRPSKKEIVDKE